MADITLGIIIGFVANQLINLAVSIYFAGGVKKWKENGRPDHLDCEYDDDYKCCRK